MSAFDIEYCNFWCLLRNLRKNNNIGKTILTELQNWWLNGTTYWTQFECVEERCYPAAQCCNCFWDEAWNKFKRLFENLLTLLFDVLINYRFQRSNLMRMVAAARNFCIVIKSKFTGLLPWQMNELSSKLKFAAEDSKRNVWQRKKGCQYSNSGLV